MERLLRADLASEDLRELGRLLSKGGHEDRELIGGEVEGEAHPLGREGVLVLAGLLSALSLRVRDLDAEALEGGLFGELDPLRLGLAGGDPRDLEDPRVGEASDEAIAAQGQVIERPGDPEGVVGAGPLPAEEVLRVRPHRGEPERVEEPALVEGAEGLYELEAKLVRDPVRA